MIKLKALLTSGTTAPLAPLPPVPCETYWRADLSSLDAVAREWTYETGGNGWGNAELQTYTGPGQNTHIVLSNPVNTQAGGNTGCISEDDANRSRGSPSLAIVARARASRFSERPPGTYTSARLTSRQTFARPRGYAHALLSAPQASGVWPAFWAMPHDVKWPDDGEVDIMETWNARGVNGTCLHWGQYYGSDLKKHRVRDTPVMMMEGPHDYGFSWDEVGRCTWYIDSRLVMRAQAPKTIRPFADFQLKLNVALGGNPTGSRTPPDGEYTMTIHVVEMQDAPPGGWDGLRKVWKSVPEGKTM